MLSTVFLLCAAVAAPSAENWPQWRGPSLNGLSGEKNLPVRWSKTENITWKLPLPAWSGSTPIVWGDHIFLNVADGRELHLWAVDRNRGVALWKRPLGGGDTRMMKQNMSSPSPVTDGRHVWVMTGTGILKAFDFAGKEIWMRDIQKDYGRFGLQWGYGSSPLLHEDALYVQVLHGMQHRRSVLSAAIDKATRQDGVARRAADPARASSRPTPTRRRRCCATAAAPRSSSPAAMSSRDTIRRPARNCGAPTASTPTTTATIASSRRRSCTAT